MHWSDDNRMQHAWPGCTATLLMHHVDPHSKYKELDASAMCSAHEERLKHHMETAVEVVMLSQTDVLLKVQQQVYTGATAHAVAYLCMCCGQSSEQPAPVEHITWQKGQHVRTSRAQQWPHNREVPCVQQCRLGLLFTMDIGGC